MLQQEKKMLREQMKKILKEKSISSRAQIFHYSRNERDEISQLKQLLFQIQMLPFWSKSHTILVYSPIAHEPDLRSFLKDSSHRFCFPRIDGHELKLYEWFSGASWIKGPHQIEEPDPTTWNQRSLIEVDLALIPGLAFDHQGGRLGRGSGYFDRLLQDPQCHALKVGIAWDCQIVPSIPREEHDVIMNFIVTPNTVFQSEETSCYQTSIASQTSRHPGKFHPLGKSRHCCGFTF